jgi:hypothetical protein
VPYSGADGVGLVDLLTGAKAFKHSTSVTNPTYVAGPLAITVSEVAAISAPNPASFTLGKNAVKTAVATAAGATSYRWTRNGVAIGETTDCNLGVGWRRPYGTDIFTVTPVYTTIEGEVVGQTASFTVNNNQPATIFVMR